MSDGHDHAPGDDHHGEHPGGHHDVPPHDPAPPEPRFRLPERGMVIRGAGFTAAAGALGWLALSGIQKSWLLAPVSAVLGLAGALAAWAAAVHLTGGEKFDDHPFV